MAKDYYKLLGVPREASEKDIRAAYRKLARKYHPDVNRNDPAAESTFKEVNEAYQALADAETRRRYDRYGDDWRHAEQFEAAGGPRSSTGSRSARRTDVSDARFDFSDLLGNVFGGRGRQRATVEETIRPQRADVATAITLEEAHAGAKRTVQTPPHPLTGKAGKRIEVKIPPGVDTGSRVHVGGSGELDITVVIKVKPHRTFERRGDDLGVTAEVLLIDAVLGSEIEVPTIEGRRVALRVPAETQNGRTFRLRGKGMPLRRGNGHGDLLAVVKVVLPQGLSDEERGLFQRLGEARERRQEPTAEAPEHGPE